MANRNGLVALISVMVIGAFLVTIGVAIALMNADELQSSLAVLSGTRTDAFVSSCVDNALGQLRNNTSLSGNVNISLGNVNCVATISGSGNTRTVIVSATTTDGFNRDITSRVNVNVNINTNPFTIESYKDILR